MKILVVDDHRMFCDGLRLILRQLEGATEVLEADCGKSALELAGSTPDIDLVMLDIKLPDGDGIEVLRALAERHPTIPVIMLTALESRNLIRRCFEAGASGYIPKTSSAAIMLDAVRLVADGGTYVPSSVLWQGAGGGTEAAADAAGQEPLTPRQAEVLEQLRHGSSNKQIAERLGLSEATVKVHISAILKALGLRSRVEAALLAQSRAGQSG